LGLKITKSPPRNPTHQGLSFPTVPRATTTCEDKKECLYFPDYIFHSLGEEKLAHNCAVNIRILSQLELDNFEIRWSLMLTDLFDSI
jgi:hypothetical protein